MVGQSIGGICRATVEIKCVFGIVALLLCGQQDVRQDVRNTAVAPSTINFDSKWYALLSMQFRSLAACFRAPAA